LLVCGKISHRWRKNSWRLVCLSMQSICSLTALWIFVWSKHPVAAATAQNPHTISNDHNITDFFLTQFNQTLQLIGWRNVHFLINNSCQKQWNCRHRSLFEYKSPFMFC
jgi:hypothetical protein